jgi:putative endonuclease
MERGAAVYIMSNKHKTVLYIGVTSDLVTHVAQHKTHTYVGSFTDRYNVEYLVYFENFSRIEEALLKEKQMKGWRSEKKIALINSINPEWKDLYDDIRDW